MATRDQLPAFLINNLRGGRNGTDPPDLLPDVQCAAAFNVDWYQAAVARKRGGADSVATSGGTTFAKIRSLFRHIPGADETAAELWGIDDAATPLVKRLAAGTSWANVTLNDAIASKPQEADFVSFNGKLFIAYDSTVDRLHAYDPVDAAVRRTGLATPAAPGAPSKAAGAVTDTRTYKVAWTLQRTVSGGVNSTIKRSELSDASPSTGLAAQQATVTRPTAPGEGETHWELYAASTDSLYWLIATTVIATTTAGDNNTSLPAITGTAAPLVGTNTVLPSLKYLTTDGNRILGAGAWETGLATSQNSRIWFTPVFGDSKGAGPYPPAQNVGDDERFVDTLTQKNYLDLNENDGGFITGLSKPLQGNLYAFKYRQIHKLVPTGDLTQPYLPYKISDAVGCIAHRSIKIGEDQSGAPCIYFASAQGPYRLGSNGVEYLGRDIEDLWNTVNLSATTTVCFAEYYPFKHQYWLWISTGSNNEPDTILVFNVPLGTTVEGGVRGGWSVYNGNLANGSAVALFANTLGATMSKDLRPYVARPVTDTLYKADVATTTDNGTAFRGYVVTKAYAPVGAGVRFEVLYPVVGAKISNGVTLTVTLLRDFSEESKSGTVSLTATGTETRIRRKVEGAALSGCKAIQLEIGDGSAVASAWTIDRVVIQYNEEAAQ